MSWKIGFHVGVGGNRDGIGEYFSQLNAANIPIFLKSVDDYGVCLEVQSLGDEHTTIFRKTGYPYELPDYSLDPAVAASSHWNLIKNDLPSEFDKRTWLEIINEPDKSRNEWLARFMYEAGLLALKDGYRLCGPSWATGEPEVDDWSAWDDYLGLCATHPESIGIALHEYSLDDNIRASSPYLVGRYSFLFDYCIESNIPLPNVLITEWGWHATSIPLYRAEEDVSWANGLYQHPRIIGAAIWFLGAGFGGIAEETQQLIQPVTELALSYEGECRGEPRIDYPRTYNVIPQDATTEQAVGIFMEGWRESRQTAGGSADDAGIGNLTSKTANLYDIPQTQRQAYIDWYEEHYPTVQVSFKESS